MLRRRSANIPPPTKWRKIAEVAEVVFDPSARQDYLTGFHKRKLQRAKHAQELAQKQEREEKIKQRKELREERKRDLDKHVAEVNALLKRGLDSSDDETIATRTKDGTNSENADDDQEWQGLEEDVPKVDGTEEYVDEDKYTSVTVKELDDIRDFESEEEEEEEETQTAQEPSAEANGADGPTKATDARKKGWSRTRPPSDKTKKKKKRAFRYESKVERQADRQKQKAKKSAAAKARKSA